jgi:hypothetical protein
MGRQPRSDVPSIERVIYSSEIAKQYLGDRRRREDATAIHVRSKGSRDRRISIEPALVAASSGISNAGGCVSRPPPSSAPPPAGIGRLEIKLVRRVSGDALCQLDSDRR